MTHSRSLGLALAAALAACSTSPSGVSGPPNIEFSATPSAVAPGSVVHLSLRNSSSATIAALPCPLVLQRWDGSTWVAVPDGAILCALVEDTLAPGARYDRAKTIDPSTVGGTYRAELMVDLLDTHSRVGVYSNAFTILGVMP